MQLNFKTILMIFIANARMGLSIAIHCYYTQIYPFCHLTSWDYASVIICKIAPKGVLKYAFFQANFLCIFTLSTTLPHRVLSLMMPIKSVKNSEFAVFYSFKVEINQWVKFR